MFLEVLIVYKNNKKSTYIIKGENIIELEERFRAKLKELSKNLEIFAINYKKSDCFVIKDGYCKELEEIIKKNFSTSQ